MHGLIVQPKNKLFPTLPFGKIVVTIPYVACLCLGEVSTKKGAKTRKFLISELCSYRLSHTGAVEAPRKKKIIISFTT